MLLPAAAIAQPLFELDGSLRLRSELLDNTFRAVDTGREHILLSRLLVHARVRGERLYAGLELQDSRAFNTDFFSPVGTDAVNALEPLQAYLGLRVPAAAAGSGLNVRVGRQTRNFASRRLLARNNFRNTANAFTGITIDWQSAAAYKVSAFYLLPNSRLPNATRREDLLDNRYRLDRASDHLTFWGLTLENLPMRKKWRLDAYLFGLDETDQPKVPSRNRQLLTGGARLRGDYAGWSLEGELALQHGTSRATQRADDVQDLDHRAWTLHASARRPLPGVAQGKLVLRFDYASGDEDPADGRMERFDRLYGARAFELGPSGIFGVLSRSNLLAPGIGVEASAGATVDWRLGYRAAWLASARDQLPQSGVSDPSGDAGRFVGHQWEAAVRLHRAGAPVQFDAGLAYLNKGDFLEQAAAAPANGDTLYSWVQVTVTF